MKFFGYLFDNGNERYCDCAKPQGLTGAKKKSFVLHFSGGEIWFEHLDGMYQYTDLVFNKLKNDSHIFLLPSKPSQISFVLDETLVTKGLVDEIVKLVCDERKVFLRVCFIGTDRKIKKMFCNALKVKSNFAFSFINDLEQAKV